MKQVVPLASTSRILPVLIVAAGDSAARRFMEFFAANARNPHTRRAYPRAMTDFMATLCPTRMILYLGILCITS